MKKHKKIGELLLQLRFYGSLFFVFYVGITILTLYLHEINRHNEFAQGVLQRIKEIALLEVSEANMEHEEAGLLDERAASLKAFFRRYNSPLYNEAEFIVQTADKYGLDYRLIPAIAMQESTGCKFIPQNSYNCWGWGIYGNKITRFSSFREGIEIVTKGLKEKYVDKGLVTPEQIMSRYNPGSPEGAWAFGVNTFLKRLEQY